VERVDANTRIRIASDTNGIAVIGLHAYQAAATTTTSTTTTTTITTTHTVTTTIIASTRCPLSPLPTAFVPRFRHILLLPPLPLLLPPLPSLLPLAQPEANANTAAADQSHQPARASCYNEQGGAPIHSKDDHRFIGILRRFNIA
jgi:hypothetical protein